MKPLFTILLIFLTALTVSAVSLDSLVRVGTELNKSYNYEAAKKQFDEVLKLAPENEEALAGIAFAYNRTGWLSKDDKQQKNDYFKSKEYADRLLAAYPESFQSHYLMAGALARVAKYGSAEQRVHYSRAIEDHCLAALEIDAFHPDLWHILGWLNFEISKANFLERAAARILFGGLPKGKTVENGINCLNKALNLRPDDIVIYYDLAFFYTRIGDEVKAINFLNRGLELISSAPEHGWYINRCKKLMAELVNH